jgi:hypothetical protein
MRAVDTVFFDLLSCNGEMLVDIIIMGFFLHRLKVVVVDIFVSVLFVCARPVTVLRHQGTI